jgi:ribosome recycling factor
LVSTTKARIIVYDNSTREHWTSKSSVKSLFEDRDILLSRIDDFEKSIKRLKNDLKTEESELKKLKTDLNLILDKIIEKID